MTNGLIDWIDAAGRVWGCARRRLDLKLEAWPQSVGARIQDGIPPESYRAQKYLEVFTGEALKFNLLVRTLDEKHRIIVYVHYVVPLSVSNKVHILHCSKPTYYQRLARAHRLMANTADYSL